MSILGIRDSGTKIVGDNLIFHLDAAQLRSYSGAGTSWTDIGISGSMGGTLFNGPTFNNAFGGSIVFDGTNDYYQTSVTNTKMDLRNGVSGNPVAMSGLTICMWVRPEAVGNGIQYRFVSVGSAIGGQDYEIHQGGLTTNIGLRLQGGNQGYQGSAGLLTSSIWTHIAVTLQSGNTTTTGNVIIYKNGSQQSSGTSTLNAWVNTNDVSVGRPYASNSQYYTGSIAAVHIYKRELSATEVLQNFNADRIRFGL